jgi:hypothetical protein
MVAQEQAAKIKGSSTPSMASAPKPPIGKTPRAPPTSKGTNVASTSTPTPIDQKADNKLKGTTGTEDKDVLVDPNNPDKKLQINSNLDPKIGICARHFSPGQSKCFRLENISYARDPQGGD